MPLPIPMLRALNVPPRYATGYLGDIGVPVTPTPMDFSAYLEVYLSGRWWAMDARHNQQRIGRIKQAHGRDAVDVALTTSFAPSNRKNFFGQTDGARAGGSGRGRRAPRRCRAGLGARG